MKHLIKLIIATFLLTMAAGGWAADNRPPGQDAAPPGIGELASIDIQIDNCCNPQVNAEERAKPVPVGDQQNNQNKPHQVFIRELTESPK